ncbi:unnamed protein product [Prorocentrum cordatum]|uniref:Uncharacterized protein n=1 Tax=Prorocentrum cordatum TaxID=2364126 RepID=A0ABN9QUV6_9DINO|nr:unnamed protein product [Polarella glacialis]
MLWSQGGRCYYSAVPMEYSIPSSDWRMSLERLDNELGYIVSNCVFVACEFNTPDWSRRSPRDTVYGTAQWSKEKVACVWGSPQDEFAGVAVGGSDFTGASCG